MSAALPITPPRPNDVVRTIEDEPTDRLELDDDGLLRFEGRWVAITDAQLPVMALFVAAPGRLVRNEDLLRAYRGAGGSPTASSMKSLIHRLNRRLRTVGLGLHVVRTRGAVLGRAS